MQRRNFIGGVGAVALMASGGVLAQTPELPDKTIRLVVPFSPGGSPDLIGRLMAQQYAQQTGGSMVVDNRLGANGIIASSFVAMAPPDGTTLLLATGSHAINPSIYKKLPYDTVQDLAPVTLLTVAPTLVLVVAPAFPARNIAEFLAMAKKPDSRISFGSPGIGNTLHLAGELLNLKAGTHMLHVPYKGAAPALVAAMSGEVSCVFLSTTAANIAIKAGQVRPLAVTSATRLPSMPDVPTLAESGAPGIDYNGGWMGVFAPGKTPPALVEHLSEAFNKALKAPAVRAQMLSWDTPPLGTTPDEFARFIQDEMHKFSAIVRDANVPMQ